jgi:hypothetical protein
LPPKINFESEIEFCDSTPASLIKNTYLPFKTSCASDFEKMISFVGIVSIGYENWVDWSKRFFFMMSFVEKTLSE